MLGPYLAHPCRVSVLVTLVGLPLCQATRAAAAEAAGPCPPPPAWLMDITRVAYTDLGNLQPSGDWPEKVIEDFAAAGVEMVFSRVHSGEHWRGLSWRSAYGDPDPAMKDRDGTREIVALCHKHGLRYIGYYWAQREPAAIGEQHPEWRMLNSAGKPTGYYCYNTGMRDLVRNRIVELVRDVGVDGIFFDMFHATSSGCYCDVCKARFRELTGQDPPVKEDFDDPLWQQWVDFKYRSIEEALLDFNRAIKAVNPDAALIINSWNAWAYRTGGNIRSSIRVIENVDALLEETGWYDTVDPSFFAFPARHNFMNWHLAGVCRDKRAFMWSAVTLPGWLPLTYQEPAIRVMTMITNGAVPAQSVPGRDVLARYMHDIAERAPYFRRSRLLPWCGLVVSEKSELWYGRDNPKDRYIKGVYGAFQAALERHLPVALVTDRDLELGRLDDYRVLFLPNCAILSEAEMATIRDFVRKGGGLVATYETSLYDENGRRRETFGLTDVLDAKPVGAFDNQQMRIAWASSKTHSAQLYFAPEHPWSSDPVIAATLAARNVTQPEGTITRHIPLHCRLLLVEPVEGAPSPLRLTTAETNATTGEVDRTNNVALIETAYGQGKVLYIPADVSWSFFRYGHEYLARLMELALRQVASEPPPVEVQAPTVVEAMPHLQGDRLVVHLLNDISSTGRSQCVPGESLYLRREVLPIHDVTVTFRDRSLKRFRLVPGDIALEPTQTPGGLTVTVPRLDVHCLIVAER